MAKKGKPPQPKPALSAEKAITALSPGSLLLGLPGFSSPQWNYNREVPRPIPAKKKRK
jgi:hypothetical protein